MGFLIRKLFENLLVELLRKKYRTTDVSIYYWTDKGRFHDFSLLIENLEKKVVDFKTVTSFDQAFFDFLKQFKEKANRSAHTIEIIQTSEELEKQKKQINHYLNLLCFVIERI